MTALLDEHPERDLYLRGLVWRLGLHLPPGCGRLVGVFETSGALLGVFLHSSTILLSSAREDVTRHFGRWAAKELPDEPVTEILGPAEMVRAFYEELVAHGSPAPRLRLYREALPLMRVGRDELLGARLDRGGRRLLPAPLRRAGLSDLPSLVAAGRAMTVEELGIDPAGVDPEGYRRSMARKVRAGREYVWTERGRILFRASVSANTPDAALVEGVYTPPEERGRGRASRGMLALCERLLRSHRQVVLFVSRDNAAALRVYERVRFRAFDTFQAVYFHEEGPDLARSAAGTV